LFLEALHDRALRQIAGVANTYSQIYIQVVFAVEARQHLIQKECKEELHKFITGIVRERSQKLLAIHCMPDHTHLLVGLKPNMPFSELVQEVKNGSSNFINRKQWVLGRFSWQEGFGAFSYGHSQISSVIRYINNQERHHARRTFHEEYIRLLKKFEVEHDERFVFKQV
jgi:REP element-mobilizing transposase RayT